MSPVSATAQHQYGPVLMNSPNFGLCKGWFQSQVEKSDAVGIFFFFINLEQMNKGMLGNALRCYCVR